MLIVEVSLMSQWKALFIFPIFFAFIIISVSGVVNRIDAVLVSSHQKPLIILDAGHGGRDPGTILRKAREKDINLQVAEKVKKGLEKNGIRVIMTRSSDSNLLEESNNKKFQQQESLIKRVSIANQSNGAALISIHVNASDNENHFGPQTYYREGAVRGKELAEIIQEELVKIRPSHRRALVGDYFILDNSNIPAVLIELGFITNDQERELLIKKSYQQLQADAIVSGILRYLKVTQDLN